MTSRLLLVFLFLYCCKRELDIFSAGDTPLHHAARQGHTATAKYLIEHGAEVAAASALGATALHHAAGIGVCVCVYLILFNVL